MFLCNISKSIPVPLSRVFFEPKEQCAYLYIPLAKLLYLIENIYSGYICCLKIFFREQRDLFVATEKNIYFYLYKYLKKDWDVVTLQRHISMYKERFE